MSFAKFREAAREGVSQVSQSSGEPLGTAGTTDRAAKASSGPRESVIGFGTKVTGKLFFDGPAQIEGQVEGEISAKDKLSVGEGAVVNATVLGVEVWIKGRVSGDITASQRLVLQRPARVTGNISAPSLSIEEGVAFEGSCRMGGEISGVRAAAGGGAA